MGYQVRTFDGDRDAWDSFLAQPSVFDHLSFLHSYEWGEFLAASTQDLRRIAVYIDDKLIAIGQAIRTPLRLGGFCWYLPRGLVMDYSDPRVTSRVYRLASKHLAKTGAAYLRADPDILTDTTLAQALLDTAARSAATYMQVERPWIVKILPDLNQQFDWMRAHGMKKKMPYYYRRALRDGVKVRASTDVADMEVFLKLMSEMEQRKGEINKQPDTYYRDQFALMAQQGYQRLFIAEFEGKPLAAAIITFRGREASYLYAASTTAHPELCAPQAILIDVTEYCRQAHPEISRLNLWGVLTPEQEAKMPNNTHIGYSRFKRSFGGEHEQYIRPLDFVYKPLAWRLDWLLTKYRLWRVRRSYR
jgi:lipid II:glycine glycyltransferase (peptidoglycan interpeptide bridge formation enzyme)